MLQIEFRYKALTQEMEMLLEWHKSGGLAPTTSSEGSTDFQGCPSRNERYGNLQQYYARLSVPFIAQHYENTTRLLLVLHGDERMVWCTERISEDFILSVKLDDDFVVVGKFLSSFSNLTKMVD